LTAGKDVGSGRRVVFDHRTKETVERVVSDEQILKLGAIESCTPTSFAGQVTLCT
jgi:hypothetical protein